MKEEKQPESTAEKDLEEKAKDESVLGGDKSLDSSEFEKEYEPP